MLIPASGCTECQDVTPFEVGQLGTVAVNAFTGLELHFIFKMHAVNRKKEVIYVVANAIGSLLQQQQ